MLIDVTMPQLGESVSEGTLTKWLVREGDVVKRDQPLVTIATDKADSELPAPVAGRIAKIVVGEGQVVSVKALLCQIDDSGAQTSPSAPPLPPRSQANVTADAGSSRSAAGGALATPNARKAALEHDVDLRGVRGSGERGRITKEDVMKASAAVPTPPRTEPAERFGAALGADVMRFATPPAPLPPSPSGQHGLPVPGVGYGAFKVPAYRPSAGDKVIPFTRRRRITADHMAYSKVVAPHVVTVAEVDLNEASRLRESHKERYKKEGHALTILAFAVTSVARALREHPEINARVLDDAFVVFGDINIGVAVDSPDGLVVPVIRRADELGIRGVVRAIDDLAQRARSGTITADDLSGSTFSVSNPGAKGNLFGGAIINQPNVGILRMGEIQKRVVVVQGPNGDDQMAIHPVMYMALSYDHRAVDGVAANAFLWRIAELLEKADFEV